MLRTPSSTCRGCSYAACRAEQVVHLAGVAPRQPFIQPRDPAGRDRGTDSDQRKAEPARVAAQFVGQNG